MTNLTTTTCPKCGKPVTLATARDLHDAATDPAAQNPNVWAVGLQSFQPHRGRLYAVCVCTPEGPVLEMPAASAPQDAAIGSFGPAGRAAHWASDETETLPDAPATPATQQTKRRGKIVSAGDGEKG